ncbi:TIGR03746 family integrating conjugative element protein [Erwinia psidii]|uniref:PFL_4703 family integrating conjugative element protein n=1 Tax=Erwinia psidii TaxID=69224 RepID=UPI00226B9C48|nr:TIGR03746 family integrating conjugative element protein [Erwinia psidii]MCX8959092.1 TIGR03746 family integrating conjugative element protein [Erwinia psidii]
MSRFRHAVKDRDQHIRTLRAACGVLIFFLLFACAGWMQAPSRLTVYYPPDLRTGSTRPWWEVPPSTVYSFAFYIFQQLNAWPANGEVDYPAKINALSPYLTPACQNFLKADARKRTEANELTDRVRVVYEIPDHGYGGQYNPNPVDIQSRDAWVVRLDLVADEYFHTEPVKRALVRYPLRVVRQEGDAERNPFGLALDCYDGVPQRLVAKLPDPKPQPSGVFH